MCIIITGVLAPEITSVIELANNTSVQVAWNQSEGGLAADEYVVSYRRLIGIDGQCSSFHDESNVTVRAMGESMVSTTNLHLQAYSVYVVTVTGRSIGASPRSNTSSTFQFETNSSGNSIIFRPRLFFSEQYVYFNCCYAVKVFVEGVAPTRSNSNDICVKPLLFSRCFQ